MRASWIELSLSVAFVALALIVAIASWSAQPVTLEQIGALAATACAALGHAK